MTTHSSKDLKKIVKELEQSLDSSFLLIFNPEKLLLDYDKLYSSLKPEFVDIFKAFRQNILSIISVAKIPENDE